MSYVIYITRPTIEYNKGTGRALSEMGSFVRLSEFNRMDRYRFSGYGGKRCLLCVAKITEEMGNWVFVLGHGVNSGYSSCTIAICFSCFTILNAATSAFFGARFGLAERGQDPYMGYNTTPIAGVDMDNLACFLCSQPVLDEDLTCINNEIPVPIAIDNKIMLRHSDTLIHRQSYGYSYGTQNELTCAEYLRA